MRSPVAVAAIVVAGSFLAGVAAAADDDRPAATPYRPTVSTPATLSAPGWLEAEIGTSFVRELHVDDGEVRRAGVPYALKLAFTDDWGVRIAGEALAHDAAADGQRLTGGGDTGLVAKRRFAIDGASAFGIEAGVLYATARHGLDIGSGRTDWSLNGIYSADFGAWHADVNVVNTRLGARQAARSRLQTLGAIALSHPLADELTLEGEIAGARQRGAAGTAQVLGALAWAIRRDFVVDVGAARGLNRASPTWQAFAGFTVVVGRVF